MEDQYSKAYIRELAHKWRIGTLTNEERQNLEAWDKGHADEILQLEEGSDPNEILGRMLTSVLADDSAQRAPAAKVIRIWPRIAVAAAMAVVVFGAGLFYINQKSQDKSRVAVYQKDIEPAGNKAYLTLSNGKRIALDDATNGNIATQSNVQVSKTADGQLTYRAVEHSSSTNLPVAYNTIETPKGGKYEIMLPDGTHVWMNAGSKLKYPVSFASLKERRIELQGEAYFQVAHNKKIPFRVSSSGQTVEVLGTHFNVNAYADEKVVKTTLLEGSVKILQSNSQDYKLLKPGEQASLLADRIQVSQADTEQAVAWKNGDFIFADEDLKTIMREVSRWYDVDVEYKGNVNVNGIFSAFPRTMKLSQLLKALEANQGIHFKMEGRRVLVMP
ncbi:ferric-dicitrate binding protein FerR (iron transport regulator) [Pedobacter sp. AK017]|uniref:FecR family protein n=1 Tax=Pedobacter sp. AK017 TaxID=2723073 RepID=UPI001622B48B|nr:FecR family protein [Pedobacter sp. AK017]MBB5438584.1 ferric-dicitrate binding protein FerR (iron transport regulator) [Pedobacter sp. AK017]